MGPCLNSSQQLILLKPFSKDEIKAAIFSIPNHKSPRLNGYLSGFFKSTSNTIGVDICTAIMGFFETTKITHEWNCTNIDLIPKAPNPATAMDYRPISCCNTLYKGISKLLSSRLRGILPTVVHPNQSAFIKLSLIHI